MNQFTIKDNPRITSLHSLFTYTYPADFKFHGESHNFYEVIIILSGSATVAADSNVFSLKSGQAFLHPPMQFHNVISDSSKPLSVAVISFSGKHIPKTFNRVCVIENMSAVHNLFSRAQKIFNFNDIWVTSVKNNDNSHLIFIKEFETFLINLNENTLSKKEKLSISEANYSLIVKTLEENTDKNLKVGDIAKLLNMSEIGVQKTFSKYAGIGVIEYFNNIKIRKGIELLKSGLSVKETALQLGFNDANYFSTVFKRITGNPPSKFI